MLHDSMMCNAAEPCHAHTAGAGLSNKMVRRSLGNSSFARSMDDIASRSVTLSQGATQIQVRALLERARQGTPSQEPRQQHPIVFAAAALSLVSNGRRGSKRTRRVL